MKKKRAFKDKAEVIAELKKSQDFVKNMEFVKKVFYPALLESSKSIDDTTQFLSSLSSVIMETFLDIMKEKKMGELNLVSKLDSKDEKFEEVSKLVRLFDDKTLFDAKQLIEGMKSEIQMFVNEELRERPLSDLKVKWIDE